MDAPAILGGSAPLPRPSTLKFLSLPVASGASLRLALGEISCLTMRSYFTGTGREGVIAREIVASRVYISPRFVLRLRLQKGGVFAGHYGNKNMPTYIYEHDYTSHIANTCKWEKEDSLVPTYKTENHCRHCD